MDVVFRLSSNKDIIALRIKQKVVEVVGFALAADRFLPARLGTGPSDRQRGGGPVGVAQRSLALAISAARSCLLSLLLLAAALATVEGARAQIALFSSEGSVFGRWNGIAARLNIEPTAPVTVDLELNLAALEQDYQFFPQGSSPATSRLVLESTAPRTVSIRVLETSDLSRRNTGSNVFLNINALNSSGDVRFDRRQSLFSFFFTTNQDYAFTVSISGGQAESHHGRNIGTTPAISVTMQGGESMEVNVWLRAGLERQSPVTITASVASADQDKVGLLSSVMVIPMGMDEVTLNFALTASSDISADSIVDVSFYLQSDDGAWTAHAHREPIVVEAEIVVPRTVRHRPSNVVLDPGGSQEVSFWLSKAPTSGMVTVGVDLVPDGMLPDGVALALEPSDPELVFDTTNWDQEQSVRVAHTFTGDDTTLGEEIGFGLRVTTGSSTDSNFNNLELAVSGAVRESYEGTDLHLGRALGTQAVGLGQFALDVVGDQVGGEGAQGIALSGAAADPHSPGEAWSSGEDGWRTDFASLVGSGTGFSLPLGHDGRGRIWARVRYTSHSGTSHGLQPVEHDGDLFGVMYGIDRDHGVHTYGVAVSHKGSDTDFAGSGTLASADQTMLGLHPYYGLRMGGGNRLWVVGSLGWGELTAGLDSGEKIDTDTELKAIAVGLEHAMDASGIDVAVRLKGIVGQNSLDASEEYVAAGIANQDGTPVSADFSRLRAEIELGMPYETTEGRLLHPYVLVAVRLEGGDLSDDAAIEVGGGVSATVNNAYEIDVKARIQATGGDHREHSASGSISYDQGADGRGLVGSLSQEYEEDTLGTKGRIGYRWGARLLGQSGFAGPTLSYSSGNDGITTQIGFFSPRLRMMVEGGSEETLARMDINLYSHN